MKQYIGKFAAWTNQFLNSRKRGGRAFETRSQSDLQVLKRLIQKDNPVVFDIGANVGQSIAYFERIYANPIIHSFEPANAPFKKLKDAHGAKPNARLLNYGLGDAPGEREFLNNDRSDMASFLELGVAGWGKITGRQIVPVSSVDVYCAAEGIERIHILKSDTQGFELQVLRGSQNMLHRQAISLLKFEVNFIEMYKGQTRFSDAHDLLLGYNYVLIDFFNQRHPRGRLGWADVIYVSPELLDDT